VFVPPTAAGCPKYLTTRTFSMNLLAFPLPPVCCLSRSSYMSSPSHPNVTRKNFSRRQATDGAVCGGILLKMYYVVTLTHRRLFGALSTVQDTSTNAALLSLMVSSPAQSTLTSGSRPTRTGP